MPSPSDAARDLKDRGNAAFRAGDLRGALLLYDESLAAHATPAVHANRALVLLGLDEFAAAEAACDAALSGDPENVKALHRRGVARRRLGRLEAALEDYRAAAGKLPGNAKIEQELAELLAEAVAERKLRDWRLDDAPRPARGFYWAGGGARVVLDAASLRDGAAPPGAAPSTSRRQRRGHSTRRRTSDVCTRPPLNHSWAGRSALITRRGPRTPPRRFCTFCPSRRSRRGGRRSGGRPRSARPCPRTTVVI